jgi:hypothetical protein
LTQAVGVAEHLAAKDPEPSSPSQTRVLAPLEPAQQRYLWSKAVRLHGDSPSAGQLTKLREETYPESFKCTQALTVSAETPESWLEQGSQLVKEQRASDWKLAEWFQNGEAKFGHAHALLAEVNWTGPSVQELRRKASVAQTFKGSDRKEELPFEVFEAAASVGKPSIIDSAESEAQAREKDSRGTRKGPYGQGGIRARATDRTGRTQSRTRAILAETIRRHPESLRGRNTSQESLLSFARRCQIESLFRAGSKSFDCERSTNPIWSRGLVFGQLGQ